MKYNRWTVLEKLPSKGSGNGHVQFRCRCVCGTERVVRACLVIQSKSKSCGCWKSELRRQNKLKHGQAKTKDHPPTSEYMLTLPPRAAARTPTTKHGLIMVVAALSSDSNHSRSSLLNLVNDLKERNLIVLITMDITNLATFVGPLEMSNAIIDDL